VEINQIRLAGPKCTGSLSYLAETDKPGRMAILVSTAWLKWIKMDIN
jgi:hypothetical protein